MPRLKKLSGTRSNAACQAFKLPRDLVLGDSSLCREEIGFGSHVSCHLSCKSGVKPLGRCTRISPEIYLPYPAQHPPTVHPTNFTFIQTTMRLTTPNPFFLTLLPAALASSHIPSSAATTAIVSLQQTLALYPLAIDGKNFSALSAVFTQNVVANYSAPLNVLYGLEAVEAALQASLAPVTTQHGLSTFSVQNLDLEAGRAGTVCGFLSS